MKKKILGTVMIVSMVLVTCWNSNQSKNETILSDLALANVEALASGEISAGCVLGGCVVNPFYDCWLYHWGFPETFCPDAYGA